MGQATFSDPAEALGTALVYMQAALQLLDDVDAPADIGAHLATALGRLQEILPQSTPQPNLVAPGTKPV